MARTIQIRNVPGDLHRTLKARAARAGTSLSDHMLEQARCLAERPTPEEIAARLRARSRAHAPRLRVEVYR